MQWILLCSPPFQGNQDVAEPMPEQDYYAGCHSSALDPPCTEFGSLALQHVYHVAAVDHGYHLHQSTLVSAAHGQHGHKRFCPIQTAELHVTMPLSGMHESPDESREQLSRTRCRI
eukprot:6468722-Amphidinium_carterae.1